MPRSQPTALAISSACSLSRSGYTSVRQVSLVLNVAGASDGVHLSRAEPSYPLKDRPVQPARPRSPEKKGDDPRTWQKENGLRKTVLLLALRAKGGSSPSSRRP